MFTGVALTSRTIVDIVLLVACCKDTSLPPRAGRAYAYDAFRMTHISLAYPK
jgi:hypothetical protein